MNHRPVTFAIAGLGNRGLYSYGKYLEKIPAAGKVVAGADPKEWNRNELARRHGLGHNQTFKNWHEMAAQEKLADAVIIATQDQDHTAPAIAFMEKGYHVLLEKPMATTEEECRQITAVAKRTGAIFGVCHVMRYAPYFRKLKEVLDSGILGQIATVRHIEQVAFWHHAHSYVRGNWRREALASPMILAKSCHDLDILLYLLGRRCTRLSSFGALSHFRPENRPAGAHDRCLDCSLSATCPYSAKRFYFGMLGQGNHDWPLNVLLTEFTVEALTRALRDGPYGRCVYACDNDVVDHQVLSLEFEGNISATLTMTAFTDECHRRTEVFGSMGELRGNGTTIEVITFSDRKRHVFDPPNRDASLAGGHGGGDGGLINDFITAVRDNNPNAITSTADVSLESHLMAFAAERSRKGGTVEKIQLVD